MIFLANDLIYYLAATFVTLLAGFIVYYKRSFTYWKQRGLEYLEPSIPFGNTNKLFTSRANFGEQFAEFYHEFKARGLKHGGVFMFTRPFYIPTDPEIIKSIMQKDFQNFVDRGFYVNEEVDPLTGHLFLLEGAKWKNLRAQLTPTFTPSKMKMMFETIANCAKELDTIMNQATITKEPIQIKDLLVRFTTDVIYSCAFGIESNSLKEPNTPFRHYVNRIFSENTLWESFKNFAQFMIPRSILKGINHKTVKSDVEDFVMNLVKKTVEYREKNNIRRQDFLHLLLQLKNRGKLSENDDILNNDNKTKKINMTINELAAQVYSFFAGSYETSSSTLTFTLYELSLDQQLQDNLRQEINDVLKKHNNQVSYEAIMDMTYMDQVINETLRKYPPLSFLSRICTKPYDVPNTNFHIEEGTNVVIPILGLQNDPEYYPNPSKYDPERFSEENKKSRPAFTWMPFGEGPRICIGLRFGVLQTKMGLTNLLGNYRVTLNEKTIRPLKMDPRNMMTNTETGIWLNISKLN